MHGEAHDGLEVGHSRQLAEERRTGRTIGPFRMYGHFVAENPADEAAARERKFGHTVFRNEQRRVFAFHRIRGAAFLRGSKRDVFKLRALGHQAEEGPEVITPMRVLRTELGKLLQPGEIAAQVFGVASQPGGMDLPGEVPGETVEEKLVFFGVGPWAHAVHAQGSSLGNMAAHECGNGAFVVFIIITEEGVPHIEVVHDDGLLMP